MEPIKYITLLTDFGNRDPYVSEIKGILFSALPNIEIVDLSHEIQPQNVMEGALFLERIWNYWQVPSIHIVVIDPGVGTSRRILLIRDNQKILICPDNGLATFIIKQKHTEIRCVKHYELSKKIISNTFHGRDIMVPVAIQLVKRGNWEEYGPIVDDVILLRMPPVSISSKYVYGEVIHIDRFGNAITNIKKEELQNQTPVYAKLKNKFHKIPFCASYGEVKEGKPLCLYGSSNRLEIAINCSSACERLGIKVGTIVKLVVDNS
ncbi:MAG TPA: SAM-dependent chlorinase/fluorinase [Candidatus Hydrogenedens sp.]|nr:SAM-dependent chlorinase/fluorinase [Candidatus Hydrogenedens sp.]